MSNSKEKENLEEKISDAELVKRVHTYAYDGVMIHTAVRDNFIDKDNTIGALKHQGSIDTNLDILKILRGTKMATLAEMQKEITTATDTAYVQ